MKSIKIKLFCRDITICKTEDNVDVFDPGFRGVAIYSKGEIYIDNTRPFQVLFHEFTHHYLTLSGRFESDSFDKEEVCDTFGFMIDQLVLENGIDIFERLKKFAE